MSINALTGFAERLAGLSGWQRMVVAALLGALSAAAFPPLPGVLLLIPAFTGLVWLIGNEAGPPRLWGLAIGWAFGFGQFAAGLYWIGVAFLVDAETFGWMAPFAVAGLAAGLALFTVLSVLPLTTTRLAGAGRILVFAAWWTVIEWVRSWILTGFPWNLIGSAWAFSDSVLQAASVVGAYGLSLLTVAVAALPASLTDFRASRRVGALAVVASFALLGLVTLGGAVRLMGADEGVEPGVRLRLVQPAIQQSMKWDPGLLQQHVFEQLGLSRAPALPGQPLPTHVIWAETAVPFDLGLSPELREVLGGIVPAEGVIIVGAPRGEPQPDGRRRVWNSLLALDRQGTIVGTYDKAQLVPFGEYLPFRFVLDLIPLFRQRADFSAGTGRATLRLPGLPPTSPLICYEVIFPTEVVDRGAGARWMINLTNDAWFGATSGPYQHFVAARLRAVEEGLPVVRVANTGVSGVIDAYGQVRAELGLGERGFLDADLPRAPDGATLYARWGNLIVLLLVFVTALAGLRLGRR
jgi:apolipoprotein N-acyltransferase